MFWHASDQWKSCEEHHAGHGEQPGLDTTGVVRAGKYRGGC